MLNYRATFGSIRYGTNEVPNYPVEEIRIILRNAKEFFDEHKHILNQPRFNREIALSRLPPSNLVFDLKNTVKSLLARGGVALFI